MIVFEDVLKGKINLTKLAYEDYAYLWLVVFMTAVGIMKSAGKMSHKNSKLVGIFELIGGAILLPAWSFFQTITKMSDLHMILMGSSLIMTALGIVTGDRNKTFSPICWVHAFITVAYCTTLPVSDIEILGTKISPTIFVALFMTYGHLIGRSVGDQPIKGKKKNN